MASTIMKSPRSAPGKVTDDGLKATVMTLEPDATEGLHNFAPLGTMTSSSPMMAQPSEVMLQATAPGYTSSRNLGTDPASRDSPLPFGQLDGVSSDSTVDVLYRLGTTQDPGTKDRIHSLLQWVRDVSRGSYSVEGHSPSTSGASAASSLGEYGILEPSPSHLQCVAAILWHSYELPVDYDLPALLDRELFELLYNWSMSLPCNVVMKKAVDSLLCSMCHINPDYFSVLMSRMGIVALGTSHYQAQHNRRSKKKKQNDANIINDSEHARLLINLSQSELATLAAASQSPGAIKQLLDSGFPSLLVRSLYQLCCGLLASAELPLSAVATSQVEAPSQPLLSAKLAVPMLSFLTEVGNSHAMKDWLGGPEVSQLWSVLLFLLCHSSASPGANTASACVSGTQAMKPQPSGSCYSLPSAGLASGLTTQQRTTLENTTVAFFLQCISCHPTNQRLMAQLLCELYQPASQRGNVPKSGNLSGFIRQLFSQLMLDEEKVTVSVQSSCPLYQGCKDRNGTSHVIQHPKYGAGHKYRTLHLPISTTLAEVLDQVSDTPSITAPVINKKWEEMKEIKQWWRKKNKDKKKMKADSGFQDSYSANVASDLKSESKHVLSTPQRGQFMKKLSVCQMTSSSGMDPTAKPTSVSVFHLYHKLLPGHPLPVELTLAQLLTVLYNHKLPPDYRSIDLTVKLGPDTAMDESLLEASPIESPLQVFASMGANMLPFHLLQALFSSTPLTTEDGLLLRRKALEVGAINHILSCLSAVSHHSPHFPNARAIASEPRVLLTTEKQKLYWAKGTGFNSGSTASVWDIEQSLSKRRLEEEHVSCLLQVLASYINPAGSTGGHGGEGPTGRNGTNGSSAAWPSMLREVLSRSCLIPVMSSYLRNDSVMDMALHVPLYRALLELLWAISTCAALVPLLLPLSGEEECSEGQTSMSMLLAKMKNCIDMYTNCLSSSKQTNKQEYGTYAAACGKHQGKSRGAVKTEGSDAETDDLTLLVSDIQRTAKMVCAVTTSLRQANQDTKQVESSNKVSFQPKPLSILRTLEKYVAATKKLQFDTFDMASEDNDGKMVFHVNYHYKPQVTDNNTNTSHANSAARARRLAQEAVTLSTSLPLSSSSSVFVRCDDERLDIMKVLITGPPDSPYANGCFEFDVYFPQDYPNSPPLINLKTTGGQSVRFNPNLYNNGYVCLSILNTWSGRPEERWNPQTSTLLQVLVSLQSLILVPEPYFNEPGYEGMRGTPNGTNSSRQYNANIRQATVKWAMLEQMSNPSPCFKEVIHRHFYLKRAEIVAQCEEWIADGGAAALKGNTAQLRDKLLKLCCPEGLESNEEFSDVSRCQPKVLVAPNKSLPSSPQPSKIWHKKPKW